MKNNFLLIITCILTFYSCELNSDESDTQDEKTYISQWHLINASGGISGGFDLFDLGVVIWVFDEVNSTLTVVNDNNDPNKEDFLSSGTYSYSTLEESGSTFLIIDSIEYGELTFQSSGSIFVIDGNQFSTGIGTDGFNYTFQKVLVENI